MIRTILNSLTRVEVLLSNLDRSVRTLGERMNRRNQNSRWMNG